MNQRQQSLRSAAARAFMESLDQLQETLQPTDAQPAPLTAPENKTPDSTNTSLSDPFDLSSFEQAVADIEAFIQTRQETDEEVGN